MTRFVHFEENDDGTCTSSMSFDGENEVAFVITVSFDDIINTIAGDAVVMEASQNLIDESNIITIPNGVDD